MKTDEQAIRDLVVTWLDATKRGDIATVLSLMADDVVFMVPGQEPFGKEAFAASAAKMKNVAIEGTSDIQEFTILGDWAWMRNRLKVTITPPNGVVACPTSADPTGREVAEGLPRRTSGYFLRLVDKPMIIFKRRHALPLQ